MKKEDLKKDNDILDENIESDKKNFNTSENNIEEDVISKKGEKEIEIESSEELIKENENLKDKLIRSLADFENLRKRSERDRRDAELYGGTKLARDLLSVFDNLSRALENINDDLRKQNTALVEGIELTQRDLLTVFSKHKIEKIFPKIGDKFDPKLHQAMFETPLENTEKGNIIQVMTTGFKIGDRLLRASQVGVSSFEDNEKEEVENEEEK